MIFRRIVNFFYFVLPILILWPGGFVFAQEVGSSMPEWLGAGNFSLLFLTVVLAGVDGFNVCSLGALLVVLSLVLGLKSRKLTFIVGLSFIGTAAFTYGILVLFWYRVFVFIAPFQKFFELALGLAALLGGLYFASRFLRFWKYGPTCDVESGLISKATIKIESLFKERKNVFLLVSAVFLFAILITLVEFPCSAALPLSFAGIVAGAGISLWSTVLLTALYAFVYFLDELFIFSVALFTKKIFVGSSGFVIWSTFIGAVILLMIALTYLLRVLSINVWFLNIF